MQAANYRCPCCGAALVFGAESQQLDCPSCGNSFPLESIEEASAIHVENSTDADMQWRAPQNGGFETLESPKMRAYRCQTCGAEIIADETTAATECVYCGNPAILPDTLTGVYRPDSVIPFQKSRRDAQAAFRNHCKSKKLLPKGFFDETKLEKITGIYVPFWLFQCEAEADMTYNATRVQFHQEGDWEVTRTQHFLVRRGGHVGFNHVPVDGSGKMDDAIMESIEPYDEGQARQFAIGYLSGYQAQRHDRGVQECQPRANDRIRRSVQQLMAGTVVGYSSCVPINTQVKMENDQVSQALLPVWLLNTKWRDKTYTFAMNGQTGQFIGDLPTDWGKFALWLLGTFLAVSGVGYVLMYILYALGVL